MREIKFRVMNGKIICAYEQLNKYGWTHVLMNNNTKYAGCFDEMTYGHNSALPRNQYTGLKDKNGKEIYEGDIVHQDQYQPGHNHTVVFIDSRFCLSKYDGYTNYIPTQFIEVIGNIYEHPELIQIENQITP